MDKIKEQETKRNKERERLEKLNVDYADPLVGTHGVLLSNQIEMLCNKHDLVKPFNPSLLKPAAYKLTIGDEWFIGGEKYGGRSSVPSRFVIKPFEVAIIKTQETIALPRFLIARWNLRVELAYSGLLWVGAAQVDAGYRGHLFCPIYNLSDKEVELQVGQEIAIIDFIKTTNFVNGCVPYKIPKRLILEDYKPEHLVSALDTQLKSAINRTEGRVNQIIDDVRRNERHIATFSAGMFTVVAVLVTVMGLLIGFKNSDLFVSLASPTFVMVLLMGGSFGILTSLFQWFIRRSERSKESWFELSMAALLLTVFVGLAGYEFSKDVYIEQIRLNYEDKIKILRQEMGNEIKKLRAELDAKD